MNRKLKLLQRIFEMTHYVERPVATLTEQRQGCAFIREWVAELERYEEAMVLALAPYLPEEEG